MKKTLYLYIWKEILPIFFIGLMTFTIILLTDKIFKLIELIINKGGNVANILMLLFYISPSFLAFTIPTSVLLGILLTLGRLSRDRAVPAFWAGWSPTFMFGGLGIYLLIKAANESPFKPAVWVIEGLDLLQKKWRNLSDHV
jgi:lipopolysaccharide export LptBFGC system permease protein LptF